MEQPVVKSPRWGSTTKLLVGLVMIGIVAFLISRFGSLITPLLMIFIIAYLFHPLTAMIANGLRISWKAAVNILYAIIFISLIGILTVGGIGLVQQVRQAMGRAGEPMLYDDATITELALTDLRSVLGTLPRPSATRDGTGSAARPPNVRFVPRRRAGGSTRRRPTSS